MNQTSLGTRAVVLGGSMAGLLAARVLAGSFAEVVLVDRDQVVGVTGYRRGVPHGRHAHGLVARGQQVLESLFPGLTERLAAAGAIPGDFNQDIRWILNGERLKPSRSGLVSVPAGRPLLEQHVRSFVEAIPNVTFLEQCDVVGLTTTDGGRRVTRARVAHRTGTGDEVTLAADLVVDTTGRGSRTPVWLEELGFARPDEDKIKIGLAYTTRHYRLNSDPFNGDQAIIPAATPSHPRGAVFFRMPGSDDRAELSLTGILGDHAPTDPDGFTAFARSLPVPEIYEAIKDAEPIDDPVSFSFPASVRRRYERLREFPERLLVMGDAVCSFNPVYAQGMTVASLQALTLGRLLSAGSIPEPLAFFHAIAGDIDSPWDFVATADLGYPGVEGKRTPKIRFVNAYVDKVQRAGPTDEVLTNAFVRVAGLVDAPQSLLRPALLVRVLRSLRQPPPAAGAAGDRAAGTRTQPTS